jgi:hypothetical protein
MRVLGGLYVTRRVMAFPSLSFLLAVFSGIEEYLGLRPVRKQTKRAPQLSYYFLPFTVRWYTETKDNKDINKKEKVEEKKHETISNRKEHREGLKQNWAHQRRKKKAQCNKKKKTEF